MTHTICTSSRLLHDEVERTPEDKMKRNKKIVVASKQVRPLTWLVGRF